MKTVTIKKVSVGQYAKLWGIVQATIAFILGAIATVSVAAGAIHKDSSFLRTTGLSLAALGLGVILYPLIAFFLGWLQGAISALIINYFFNESGGLEINIEEGPAKK